MEQSDSASSSAFQKYQKFTDSSVVSAPSFPRSSAVGLSHAIFPLLATSCRTAPVKLITNSRQTVDKGPTKRQKNSTTTTSVSRSARDRRCRTTFSVEQTNLLEEEFSRNEYVSRVKRLQLANCLGLNESKIKIWFQNRRAKHKRIEKAQNEHHYRCLAVYPAIINSFATIPVTNCDTQS